MTNGEARTVETDVVIFSAELTQDNKQTDAVAETVEVVKFDETTNKFDLKNRFARLKKSLRKRSVSIL